MAIEIGHTDKIAAGLLVALAAAVFAVSADFPSLAATAEPGPAFYPRLVAATLAALGMILLVRSLGTEGVRRHRITVSELKRVGGAVLFLLAYVALMPVVGFIADTFAYLLAFMWFSKVRSLPVALGVSAGVTLTVYYVFVAFLHVPLPEGSLVQIARYLPDLPVGG